MDEEVLVETDRVYCWPAPKRKSTLLSATLGRVVLTNQRLLFLSTGKHDVTVAKLAGGALGGTAAAMGMRSADTGHLDLSALANKGSLSVPLGDLRSADLKGMFKVLVVEYTTPTGTAHATFAPKNGGMPDGPYWVAKINAARTAIR
jgi:hypothetical protein